MPYTAQISRGNPGCFLFLIDQSGSMDEKFAGSSRKKCQFLADAINRILRELCLKSASGKDVRDYFHVGVIGYGKTVGPAFRGKLSGMNLVPLSEIAKKPDRVDERTKQVEDGMGGLVEEKTKMPVWFDPVAENGTPMVEAFQRAQSIVSDWLRGHDDCYPPVVLNLTDGEASDGDAKTVASAADILKGMSSQDGNVLLLNAHISASSAQPIEFPDRSDGLADEYARMLFDISSVLPEQQRRYAQELNLPNVQITDRSRGFVFNGEMASVIRFLDIGTKVSTKLLR